MRSKGVGSSRIENAVKWFDEHSIVPCSVFRVVMPDVDHSFSEI